MSDSRKCERCGKPVDGDQQVCASCRADDSLFGRHLLTREDFDRSVDRGKEMMKKAWDLGRRDRGR